MTQKTIMIGLVAIAFVAGSILTGTMAYAAGDKNGTPFEALWDAIHALETAISLDDDADSSNEDQTLSGTGEVVLGTTAAGDGGGTVTCADITGGAGLCDGDDAVVDNDNDSSNELQGLSGTGSVDLSNGGGSVSCESITGGAGLCDGNDAVVDADSNPTNEIQTFSTVVRNGEIGSVTPGDPIERFQATCLSGEFALGPAWTSSRSSITTIVEDIVPIAGGFEYHVEALARQGTVISGEPTSSTFQSKVICGKLTP